MGLYVLMMNDMRQPNIENLHAVRWGTDREELRRWHDSLRVEPYRDDDRWAKSFERGSVLEWCNPVYDGDWDEDSPYFGGIYYFANAPADADASGLRISK
jgi:hypothetical protein